MGLFQFMPKLRETEGCVDVSVTFPKICNFQVYTSHRIPFRTPITKLTSFPIIYKKKTCKSVNGNVRLLR